jgi:ribosomal protein L16 Arg81 hydroxylase
MGSRGVTTQLHYDTNFNFHVQIDGHKHFVLFPPAAMHKVHMFPRIHPHFRRSQVNLDAIDPTQFPTFTSDLLKDVVEVTLERGDALYIPPFWGHHVTNVDGGVSVNVWTENIEFKSWSAGMRFCVGIIVLE